MFSNSVKPKNIISSDKKIEEKVNSDFVTHNMPESHRFSGQTFTSQIKPISNKTISVPNVESHYKIGILIMSGGLILVGALVYLGYLYIIKPNLSVVNTPVVVNKVATKTPEKIIEPVVEPTKIVEVVTSTEPIIATSTTEVTTSSDLILPEEQPIVTAPVSISTVDSDADGLTDAEEKVVGTDPNKADTDSDGYLDLAELKSGYDPLVPGKKTSETSVMTSYLVDPKTTIIYPTAWEVTKSDSTNTVVLTDTDKAFIQITYQDNPKKLTPTAWFTDQSTGLKPGEIISGSSWQGFYSQDGLSAYVFNKDLSKVYSFSCSPLTADTSSITLFNLMIKTLIIK